MERESDQYDHPEKAGGDFVWFVPVQIVTRRKFFGSRRLRFAKSAQVSARFRELKWEDSSKHSRASVKSQKKLR